MRSNSFLATEVIAAEHASTLAGAGSNPAGGSGSDTVMYYPFHVVAGVNPARSFWAVAVGLACKTLAEVTAQRR